MPIYGVEFPSGKRDMNCFHDHHLADKKMDGFKEFVEGNVIGADSPVLTREMIDALLKRMREQPIVPDEQWELPESVKEAAREIGRNAIRVD